MTHSTLRVAAIAVAMLTMTTAAHAQLSSASAALKHDSSEPAGRERTRGLMLGVHTIAAPGIAMTGGRISDTFSTTFGAGAGVTLGYGITSVFSAFTSLDVAKQKTSPDQTPRGSWGLAHFEVGARANLPLGAGSTVPYITGSMGRRALSARATTEDGDPVDATFSGRMFAIGGGVEHFFSPTMALDAGVGVGFGTFDHFKVDDDEWDPKANSTRSIRLRLGVTWRPFAPRSS